MSAIRTRAFFCNLGALVGGLVTVAVAATEVPAALATAVVRDPDVAPCFEQAHAASSQAYVNANFDLKTVALQSGARMAVVTGGGSCVCGNVNCKVAVFWHDGHAYRGVLSAYGYETAVRPDGSAVITSHDSADVSYRTTFRWNGKTYALSKDEMVFTPTGVAKPARRTLRFAPGQSSAVVSGDRVALGFEDHISFDASAGQTVTLTLLKHGPHFGTFSLLRDGISIVSAAHGTLTKALSKSGRYELLVDGSDENLSSYSIDVSIH
jgi:hypothetical protein